MHIHNQEPDGQEPEQQEPEKQEKHNLHGSREDKVTATAPDSVEKSVYEEADHVGKDGIDAASPSTAAKKSEHVDVDEVGPGPDLDADEAADVMKTREEAARLNDAKREDTRDEDIISLDVPD